MNVLLIDWFQCECCGNEEIEVLASGYENTLSDGDECKCNICGNSGNISVDEESGDVWTSWYKYPKISQKITIRFNDRSKSQCFKCKFAWSDGYNTVVYDEEGKPLLVGNNCYEIIRDGWAVDEK